MEWLKSWVNQIMVAVVIAALLELILPAGKNKKYIKMVIHLYVLFAIINPIVSKVTNQSFNNLLSFDTRKYFENTVETSTTFDSNAMIENTFETSVKQDIKAKLLAKGYKVNTINIDINKDETLDTYGTINKIELSIQKQEEKKSSHIVIENITIESENETKETTSLRKVEKESIKKFLEEEYQVKRECIEVY